jgi:hypothetical protein
MVRRRVHAGQIDARDTATPNLQIEPWAILTSGSPILRESCELALLQAEAIDDSLERRERGAGAR